MVWKKSGDNKKLKKNQIISIFTIDKKIIWWNNGDREDIGWLHVIRVWLISRPFQTYVKEFSKFSPISQIPLEKFGHLCYSMQGGALNVDKIPVLKT